MWPFIRRKTQPEPGRPRRPLRFRQLLEGMGSFRDLAVNDTALKFWLPEPAAEAMMELSEVHAESVSVSLRQFLAQHCYGVYAVGLMDEAEPGIFGDEPRIQASYASSGAPASAGAPRRRVDTYWVPELGKNVVPVKVWIPARLRRDLHQLADHAGIPLSQYVREIVISRVLGHGTLPKRPEMLAASPTPAAHDWGEDRPVPLRPAGGGLQEAFGAKERRREGDAP